MGRWRRWVFELRAPADEFVGAFQRSLIVRGIDVSPAERFDFAARAFGAKAYIKVAWEDEGLAVTAKFKSGLFAAPAALEHMLLEAGREAQARVTYEPPGGA